MQARLPPEKLLRYSRNIEHALQKHTIQLRDLKSIIGQLQFSTTVVPSGRAFLRRLHDLTIGLDKPFYYVTLTKQAKADLQMWRTFLNKYNGITIIRQRFKYASNTIRMCSDSSTTGFGATYGSQWIQGLWPAHWKALNIAVLELFPIYLLLAMFAHKLTNAQITFLTDNQAVVHVINKQTSKCPIIMQIVRQLVLLLLHHNIILHAAHVPGNDNTLCDLISRQKTTPEILRKYGMSTTPLPVPRHLRPEAFKLDFSQY